jgi:hypothetical protein
MACSALQMVSMVRRGMESPSVASTAAMPGAAIRTNAR